MKKIVALIIALVMIVGCVSLSFARPSRSSSGSSSSSSVITATTFVSAEGASGTWAKDAAGKWSFSDGTKTYKSTWALVKNPAAKGATQWFFFDENGHIATGWVWIKGADGITRCYCFGTSGDFEGALYMNGKTPDGYYVDSTGAWTVNGVVQTR